VAAAVAGWLFLSDGWAVAGTLFIRAHTQAAFIAAYSSLLAIDTSARVNGGRGARLRLFQTHAPDNGDREQPENERDERSERVSGQAFECSARLKYLLQNNPGPFHFIRTRRAGVSASHFSRASLSDFNSSGPDCIQADDSRLHYYFVESKKYAPSKLGKFACRNRSSPALRLQIR
jgi:hypothetical protein